MCLFELRIGMDGLLIVENRLWIIPFFSMDNAQLKISGRERELRRVAFVNSDSTFADVSGEPLRTFQSARA